MAYLVMKHGAYYAVVKQGIKKHWIRLGKLTKRSAQKALQKLELDNIKLPETTKTLPVFAQEYLQYAHTEKAQSTWKREQRAYRAILAFFNNIALHHITEHHIDQYKAHRKAQGLSNKGINRELEVLRHSLHKAQAWGYITRIPQVKKLTVPTKPRRFLTIEEVTLLLKKAPLWAKTMITFMVYTGARRGEMFNLKWTDIDLEHQTVTLHATKTHNFRIIRMTQPLRQMLEWMYTYYVSPSNRVTKRQPHQKTYVFCNPNGKKLNDIRHAMQSACLMSELEGVTPHTLRHTFASHLVMQGVDLPTVQYLLGHKNLETTSIYIHLMQSHTNKAIDILPYSVPIESLLPELSPETHKQHK
jgi:site-specific recombinase XerD